MKMVAKVYGKAVRQDVLGEVKQRHFIEAIVKENQSSWRTNVCSS